jgi:pimeloyl-ACP methyl ester carboxylesterase
MIVPPPQPTAHTTRVPQRRFLDVTGHRLEYVRLAGADPDAPTLVFLHEGLGSLDLWRGFPARVVAACGCPAVVYSRRGHGRSEPLTGRREPDYLVREAREALPALLAALGVANPLLVGHSDGASIALIHAASGAPVRGIVAMAPHAFVEEITLAGIRATRELYETTDLRARLARWHEDVDATFYGWCDIWLDPRFRGWNIRSLLPDVTCPLLLIQGEDDEYGTLAQLDAIAAGVSGPAEMLALADCGHTPWRDQADVVAAAIARFVGQCRGRVGVTLPRP